MDIAVATVETGGAKCPTVSELRDAGDGGSTAAAPCWKIGH